MRRGGRAAALLSGLLLFAACTLNSSPTASVTPTPTPTPSPSQSPSSSPTSAPTSTPTSSPSSGPALAIASLPFHNGEVGVIYLAVQLGASGGTPGYSWSISGGTFPPGLNLSTGGGVTGNNTAAGNFAFTITVTDSTGATASHAASMHVFPALVVTQPCAGGCGVEEGCTICGNFGSVSGGLPPYHLSIVSDNRPTGMGLAGLDLTGAFPGPGNFSMKIQVKDDQFGATRIVTANWSVFAHIAFSGTTAFTCGFSGDNCVLGIPYSGGTPGGSASVKVVAVVDAFAGTSGDQGAPRMTLPSGGSCVFAGPPPTVTPTGFPPGTTISASAGMVTISMAGQFAGNSQLCSYTARVVIELVDQSPCGPGNCTTLTTATIDIGI